MPFTPPSLEGRGWGEGAAHRLQITSMTPSRFPRTSLFQNLSTAYPSPCSRASLLRSSALSACWPPSTSMISFFSRQTKSTMYTPIGCCRLNFSPDSPFDLRCLQRAFSASVWFFRSCFACGVSELVKVHPHPDPPPSRGRACSCTSIPPPSRGGVGGRVLLAIISAPLSSRGRALSRIYLSPPSRGCVRALSTPLPRGGGHARVFPAPLPRGEGSGGGCSRDHLSPPSSTTVRWMVQ